MSGQSAPPAPAPSDLRLPGTLNPRSTTFYEHKLFMFYEADDFRQYVLKLLPAIGAGWPEFQKHPESAWLESFAGDTGLRQRVFANVWGTAWSYMSRQQPFAFSAELAKLMSRYAQDGDRKDGASDAEVAGGPLGEPYYLQRVFMQMAVEVIASEAGVDDVLEKQPTRAQLLFETLYIIAYIHFHEEIGEAKETLEGTTRRIVLSRDGLREYLAKLILNAEAPDEKQVDPGKGLLGPQDLDWLFPQLRSFVALLASREGVLEQYEKLRRKKAGFDGWAPILQRLRGETLFRAPLETDDAFDLDGTITFAFLTGHNGQLLGQNLTEIATSLQATLDEFRGWQALLERLSGSAANAERELRQLELLPGEAELETMAGPSQELDKALLLLREAKTPWGRREAVKQGESLRNDVAMFLTQTVAKSRLDLEPALRTVILAGLVETSQPASGGMLMRLLGYLVNLSKLGSDPARRSRLQIPSVGAIIVPAGLPQPDHRLLEDALAAADRESNWAAALLRLADLVDSVRARLGPEDRRRLAAAYWPQWTLNARKDPGAATTLTRRDQAVTVADLMHVALRGGRPLLGYRSFNASMWNWGVILAAAQDPGEGVPPEWREQARKELCLDAAAGRSDAILLVLHLAGRDSAATHWLGDSATSIIPILPPDGGASGSPALFMKEAGNPKQVIHCWENVSPPAGDLELWQGQGGEHRTVLFATTESAASAERPYAPTLQSLVLLTRTSSPAPPDSAPDTSLP